jgi:hypothetical protein
VVAIAVVACGCFHPSPPAGIPCGANGECPSDQVCDTRLSPPTCVDSLDGADGGVGSDGDLPDMLPGVDAPPPGACVADTDCDNGICHELDGSCIPDAEVLFVAPNGQGTACTRMAPCGSLQTAIDARTQTRFTVALAAGNYSTSFDTMMTPNGVTKLLVSGPVRAWDQVVITSSAQNRVHTGLTAIFEGVTIRGAGDNDADGINSRGTTTISRVWIDLANRDGVACAAGTATILDSQITKSTERGVYASGGTLSIERTQILSNTTFGIHVDGAQYSIVNSIIASNGSSVMQTSGVRLRTAGNGGMAVFRFNTLARNQGLFALSMTCDNPVNISNVIVGEQMFLTPTIGGACSATYSLFNTMAGMAPAGTGNIAGDPMFVSTTDFHLKMGSPAIDKANPNGAVSIDIDGQQRVSPPDIGADERL